MKTRRNVSPTEKQASREAAVKHAQKEHDELTQAFNEICGTYAGVRILKHIAKQAGFGQPKVVMRRTPEGEILPMEGATLYNCARESVYIDDVREYLTPNNRMKVEKNL